jgi:hypothetical protein
MAHAERTPITPLQPIKFASAPALIPPLEAIDYSGTEVVCHICGKVEDARDFEPCLAHRLLEHDLCFSCFFDEHEKPAVSTRKHTRIERKEAA